MTHRCRPCRDTLTAGHPAPACDCARGPMHPAPEEVGEAQPAPGTNRGGAR